MNIREINSLLPDCGLNRQRMVFFKSTALPISYPTPRDGCVTSASTSAKIKTIFCQNTISCIKLKILQMENNHLGISGNKTILLENKSMVCVIFSYNLYEKSCYKRKALLVKFYNEILRIFQHIIFLLKNLIKSPLRINFNKDVILKTISISYSHLSTCIYLQSHSFNHFMSLSLKSFSS